MVVLLLAAVRPAVAQMNLVGEWSPRYHEDQPERIPGPELGDYTGLPITDGARLTVTWRPHRRLVVHDSATISTPEAFAVGGPECSPEIAGRTVYLERTAEFPSSDSSLLWLTTATWEEMPGTDVLVTAGARDTGAQLEQLRAIWSLAR